MTGRNDIWPSSDDIPKGCDITEEDGLFWVSQAGRRLVSAPTREAAIHQAVLLTAFEVKDTVGYFKDWPEMGAFRGNIFPSGVPDRVRPKLGIYFDWTYRKPVIKLLISADYACWLLWRQARDKSTLSFIRQTDPVLVWFFFHMVDRPMPIYGVLPYGRRPDAVDRRVEVSGSTRFYDPTRNETHTITDVITHVHVSLATFLDASKRLKRIIG